MSKQPLALVIEADEGSLARMSAQLRRHHFEVVEARSLVEANARLDEQTPDLAIVALDLPDGDGIRLLAHPGLDSARDIILTNDEDDPERVREGVLAGAGYFFCHPADQQFMDDLLGDLTAELNESYSASISHFSHPAPIDQFGLLRGSSPGMHKLYRTLRKVAPSEVSVYLVGESGSGKDLVAQTIHLLSQRCTGPFVALDCAALTAEQMERELFGCEQDKGAGGCYIGYLERAFGGTLFIDDILSMPMAVQIRLLHALENHQFRRVGGERDLHMDARILVAGSCAPQEAVKAGLLCEGLCFRVDSFPVTIPPLRARGDDICGLAEFFLTRFSEQSGSEKTLSSDGAALLRTYSWPGNVRELRRVMEQAYLLADRDITPEHLADIDTQPTPEGDVLHLNIGDSVQDAEKKLTLATLTFYNGDKRKAAQTLGVSLKTLYNRINAYQADKGASSVSNAAE